MSNTIPEDILPDSTFACGPSQGHPDIRRTPICDTLFERSHRAPDIAAEGIFAEATANIKKLLRVPDDYMLIFFMGGATPALDAAMWNLATDSVSGYCFGAFSNLWGKKIAPQIPDVTLDIADLKEGEKFPTATINTDASFVFLTPNETSSGVIVPNNMLTDIYSHASDDSLVAWDCTSCAGGRLLPRDSYDVMIFSLQKSFGCPGGTGVMILSPKAIARAEKAAEIRNIPHSLQLSGEKKAIDRAQSACQTANTPSNSSIWMANEAAKIMLEAGGLEAMDALVMQHAKVIWDWVENTDYVTPYMENLKFRSDITVTLTVDPSIEAMDISKALIATGKPNLQDGVKKYSGLKGNAIRIGCFPFVDFNGTEQFEKLTKVIDYIVENM
jgi:phosphoserine aminotransferase